MQCRRCHAVQAVPCLARGAVQRAPRARHDVLTVMVAVCDNGRASRSSRVGEHRGHHGRSIFIGGRRPSGVTLYRPDGSIFLCGDTFATPGRRLSWITLYIHTPDDRFSYMTTRGCRTRTRCASPPWPLPPETTSRLRQARPRDLAIHSTRRRRAVQAVPCSAGGAIGAMPCSRRRAARASSKA